MAPRTAPKIAGAERARDLLQRHLSPRYRRLDQLEAYVECRQYDGRPAFNGASKTPLLERAPSINYPVVDISIESNADLILGEGRWPEFTTFSSEDDRQLDPEFGLNEVESAVIDNVVKKAIRQARLVTVATEALSSAQGSSSSCAVYGIRNGRMVAETVRAKWCTPTFREDEPSELESVEIRYPYVDQYWDKARNGWAERCMLYRRTVDAQADTVYQPVEATEDGVEPAWTVDKKRTKEHGLGFCPARWYPFLKPVASVNEIDGKAIHDGRFALIDSLNFALSQKDRAAFYCGDPQMVETGVSEDENPAEAGRSADVSVGGSGFEAHTSRATSTTRRRGAATVWSYRDPQAKVLYLTLGSDALKALEDNGRDLRAKLQEALRVIFIDPDHARHAAEFSNKAIRTLLKRQLSHCDKIREDFGNNFLIPSVCMMLRIAHLMHKRSPGSVYLPGIAKASPILDRFEREVGGASTEGAASVAWFNPHMDLNWGPYFEPDAQEENQIVQGVVQAYGARIIDRKTAVKRLPDSFGIDNPDAYVEAIEGEEDKAHDRQLELTHAMNRLATAGDDDGTDGTAETDASGGSGDVAGRKAAASKARDGSGADSGAADGDAANG